METDKSGSIVSLSSDGTIVAIGAILNDGGGNDSGHVRVYQYANNTWTQLGQDIDGEAILDKSGSSVSLSSDGTIVAIGAYGNDGNGSGAGHVRVYQYNGTTWTQLGEDIDGEAGEDNSGLSVSLSSDGTILAIGAPYNDGNGDKSGHVRVYQYANNTWTQLGLDIDGEAAGDYSGSSNNISLSGDGTILAIGAVANDGNADYSGHVRIYQWNGTDTWTQLGSDIDGESIYDYSGWSVSLSNDGTILAIGAPYNDGNDEDRGHVRIYKIADIGEPPPPDTGNPVITLNGSNPTNVNVGETYTELATASDNNDGDITSDIVITGSVNTSVSGSYTLTYNVKDAADNSAIEVTRTVIVKIPGALIENLQVPTTFTIKDDYIYIFNGLTKKIVRYDMDGNLDNSNLVQLTKNATDMIFDSQNNLIVSEENGDILKIANVWKQGTPSDNSNYK